MTTNLTMFLLAVLASALVAIAVLAVVIYRQRRHHSHKSFHKQKSSEIRFNIYTRISRELRAPLNIIIESCKTLQEKDLSQLPESELHTLIDNIHANSHKMLSSIDELKEVSGFNGNVPELDMMEVDLVELIMSYRREILHETQRGVVVGIHTELPAYCMATLNTPLFRQLIMHLLRVCAHRTSEGHINISYKKEGDGLRFLIEDTGGSVPEKYRPLIFNDVDYDSLVIPPYYLSKTISLNICKTIVATLHGTIEPIYKEEGVAFNFWIPCRLRYQ